MNEIIPIKPIGYGKEAVLYGYGSQHVVDMETLGRLLYAGQKDPVEAIRLLFKRNKKYFTEKDTVLLKVDTFHLWRPDRVNLIPAGGSQTAPNQGDLQGQYVHAGGSQSTPKEVTQKRDMRFFTLPYGVIKICKFSRSPLAVEVLERMIEMHEAFIRGTLARWERGIAPIAQMPKWTRGRGRLIEQEAEAAGVSGMTIRRHAERMRRGEPITRKCPGMVRYCHKKHRDIKDEVIALRRQGVSVKDIVQKTKVPIQTVYRWVKG